MIRPFRLAAALVLGLMAAAAALPAAAQSVDSAKASGYVGERADGLLGLVKSAPPEIRALVDQVNAKRMAGYRDIAQRNSTSVQAVQSIVGQKLIDQAGPGNYVMEGGGWRMK